MRNPWLLVLEERARQLAKEMIEEDEIKDVRTMAIIYKKAKQYVREFPTAKE